MSHPDWRGRAVDTFDRAVRWLAIAGGVVLVLMVLLTVIDLVVGKLLNTSLFGRQNISELALVVVVFFAMGYCGRIKGHVSVDLISAVAGPRLLRLTDIIVSAVGAAVFVILAWRAVLAGRHAADNNAVSNLLEIPHWPFYIVIAVGSVLYAVVLILDAFRAATGGADDAPKA